MNGFDYIALAALVMAALRGRRNGLALEFYRLFRMAVALLAGTSLYGMLSHALSSVMNITSGYADPLMFVTSSVVTWKLLRRIRSWMEIWIKAKVPGHWQAAGGSIAAATKTAVLIAGLVTMFDLADWLPGHESISQDSITSQIVRFILPET